MRALISEWQQVLMHWSVEPSPLHDSGIMYSMAVTQSHCACLFNWYIGSIKLQCTNSATWYRLVLFSADQWSRSRPGYVCIQIEGLYTSTELST
jgi:hypothetical protein